MKTITWAIKGISYSCEIVPGACPFCLVPDVITALPPPVRANGVPCSIWCSQARRSIRDLLSILHPVDGPK